MENYDVAITDNGNILYYLHWIKNFGFLKYEKESYEKLMKND